MSWVNCDGEIGTERVQRVLCQSSRGERRERGTEMLGLFEALPTLQSSPCDCCLWHGAEVQTLSSCCPPTTCVRSRCSDSQLPPSALPCPPVLLWDGSSQFVAAGFRLSRIWHTLTGCFTASYRPDITCVLQDTLMKRLCVLHAEIIHIWPFFTLFRGSQVLKFHLSTRKQSWYY